jgi:hypothetical protein
MVFLPIFRRKSLREAPFFLGLFAVAHLLTACLYDKDERCRENQELSSSGDACVCVEGAALIGNACVLCGENEVPGAGECVCDELYERNGAGKCVSALLGFGEACEDDSDCPEVGATRCVETEAGSICTVDCETAADCPSPAGCEIAAEEPYCTPAPSGLDVPCTSSDECAEFEANYCETMLEDKCKVECKDNPGVCHGDFACCDYTDLIGAALCISPTDLEEGACPFGGELLEAN